jgi:tungstate transport system permease protein
MLSEIWHLLAAGDATTWHIVGVSLRVSGASVLLGLVFGLPLGAWLAVHAFPGRGAVVALLNSLLGLPSVVVGLLVYLLLSRSGPLGGLGLLFSIPAMILAQTVLTTPLIAAVSRQIVAESWRLHADTLRSLRLGALQRMRWLLWDCRHALLVAALAGFGRAISEVGAVMIAGGNIEGYTRTMTTAIALETSKGDLPLALALGTVLMALVLLVNLASGALRHYAAARYAEGV